MWQAAHNSFWEIVRGLSGWVGLIAVVIVMALIERMRKIFMTREEAAKQHADLVTTIEQQLSHAAEIRELKDQGLVSRLEQISNQQLANNTTIQTYMARQTVQQQEIADLRLEIRTGFAKMGVDSKPSRDRNE